MKVICAVLFVLCAACASGQTHMFLGNAAYQQGDFITAKKHLEMADDGDSWSLIQYNLGNCEFRLGHMDLAIWHYQRALLAPGGAELVQNNLGMAQQRLGLGPDGLRASENADPIRGGESLDFPLALIISFQTLALIGMILCRKRGFLFLVLLIILLGSVAFGSLQWSRNQKSNELRAVVLQPGGAVRHNPDRQSRLLKKLDPGEVVPWSVGSERWVRVELGAQWGWVERHSLKLIDKD